MNTVWYPHLVVATIIERDGRFLLVEEISDGVQVINQPAGHVERGETLVEAALRETLEETAWRVELSSITGFYQYVSPHNGITYFRCCFNGTAQVETNNKLDKGIIATHWLSYEEIKAERNRLRSPLVLICIEDYLSGKQLPLDSVSYIL